MSLKLNDMQQRFVDAYLVEPNGKKAAITAGYSAKTAEETASRLLRHPGVEKAIADAVADRRVQAICTKSRVMAELVRLGMSDIRSIVRWVGTVTETEDAETGETRSQVHNELALTSWDDLDADTAAAIAEIKQTRDGIVVKLHPKTPALVELGRHLGIATKIAHTGPNGTGPVETITAEMTAEQAADYYRRTLEEG